MARFNEILHGRFNRALQKFSGIKGEVPSPQLASEIMPVWPMFYGHEQRFHESWDTWGVIFTQPAVAGQFSIFRFHNPTASNMIAVIEKVSIVGSTSGTNVAAGAAAADMGTVLSGGRRDTRNPRSNPTMIPSFGAQVAGGSSANIYFAPAVVNTMFDLILDENQEITVAAGNMVELSNGAVNASLTASVWWRERFLEEPERT